MKERNKSQRGPDALMDQPESEVPDEREPRGLSASQANLTDRGEDAALADLALVIDRACAFAERWDHVYRPDVFRAALALLLEAQGGGGRVQTSHPHLGSEPTTGDGGPGLGAIAKVLNADVDAVERSVQIDQNGAVDVLGRPDGTTKRDLQTRYSLIYMFVKETALRTRMVDIDELRALCDGHGCYDQANFTSNFRRDEQAGFLREQPGRSGRARRYTLTQKGLAEGARLLSRLVGV